jgi:hypothetical protein
MAPEAFLWSSFSDLTSYGTRYQQADCWRAGLGVQVVMGEYTARGRSYPMTVTSGIAPILDTCVVGKATRIVKVIGGLIESIGWIAKSRTGCKRLV